MSTLTVDPAGVIRTCPNCGQRNRIPFEKLSRQVRCGKCHQDLPVPDEPIEVSDSEQFSRLLTSSPVPVLVDFWADWCGPCKMMAPEFARAASQGAGVFIAAKVDTEAAADVAQAHAISALPTLVLFHGGKEVARAPGARSAPQILDFFRSSMQ